MHILIIGAGLAASNLIQFIRTRDKVVRISVVTYCAAQQYYKPDISKALSENKTPDDLAKYAGDDWANKFNVNLYTSVQLLHLDVHEKTLLLTGLNSHQQQLITWDKLVYATGAIPRQINGTPEALDFLYHVNDLMAYRHFINAIDLSSEIAIVGSGLIGCEMASDLAASGYKVTVYHPGSIPLVKYLPEIFGCYIKLHLQNLGITFIDHVRLKDIDKTNGNHVRLHMDNGIFYQASVVLNCSGLLPSAPLAETIGIATPNGISVNEYLESGIKDVYALGDCAEIQKKNYLYVMPIMKSARVLAGNLLGERNKVHINSFPIQVKIQGCELFMMGAGSPTRWEVAEESSMEESRGICAQGFDQHNNIVRVALMGSKLNKKAEMMKLMMSTSV